MTTARHHHDGNSRRRGFSLAELVLALGVLAIGMTMAAALFPAAIKLNEQSARDSIGTIIAQNGLAMAQCVVPAADLSGRDPNTLWVVNEITSALDDEQLGYLADPNGGPSTQGFVVLAKPNADATMAQFILVAYKKQAPGNTVKAESFQIGNVNEKGGASVVELNDAEAGKYIGSPLIFIDSNGIWLHPRITGWTEDDEAVLDQRIDGGNVPAGTNAFVIVEEMGQDVLVKSPAMTVLIAEKVLQP